ncbi:MAG: DUF4139 domain-containing protein [Candidatus Diapherotrites archaeon]
MDLKFALGIIFVLVVLGFGFFYLDNQPSETGKAPKRIDIPNVNVKDYSYKVSSQKPAAALASFAGEETSSQKIGTELTIYNQNLGLVKEVRELFLKKGVNLVNYQDVASKIDSTSVLFSDLSYPSTMVLEQNYKYDLVSKEKLLEKYLDKEIEIEVNDKDGTKKYSGTLLSYKDGIIIQTKDGVISLGSADKISFPILPEGLITKPTLVWSLYSENEGNRNVQTTYLSNGFNWRADYIAKVNNDDTAMDFKGWVTATNESGSSYPNAKLKLVAGDIRRVTAQPSVAYETLYKTLGAAPSAEQFIEEALFEYHLYTLDRTTDLMNNESKQISLLASENVPVKKEFIFDASKSSYWYYGSSNTTKVEVKLAFKNSTESALGVPLPKGIVRVYKEDSQGQLQFLGEDEIDHTPKDEERRVFVGYAFDITGERKQVSSEQVAKCYDRQAYEITLKNHKDSEVEVIVPEHMQSYYNWNITQNSDDFIKKDSRTIEFTVKVPANGEKKITYTVEYKSYC